MQRTKRVRRSRDEARAEILAGTEAALAVGDFNALTVDDVMRRTGMTRSSFYHYFSGLDELAVGLLEEFEHEIRASVDPWLKGETDGDPLQSTRTHLGAMFEVMHAHRTSVSAVAQAVSGHPKVYQEWQTRVVDYFVEITASFIRRQVERSRSSVDDPDRLARSLILMNNAVANDSVLRGREDDPASLAHVLAGVWNAAIYGRAE